MEDEKGILLLVQSSIGADQLKFKVSKLTSVVLAIDHKNELIVILVALIIGIGYLGKYLCKLHKETIKAEKEFLKRAKRKNRGDRTEEIAKNNKFTDN